MYTKVVLNLYISYPFIKQNYQIYPHTLSGASSLEKRGLSWKGSFWYHFSA